MTQKEVHKTFASYNFVRCKSNKSKTNKTKIQLKRFDYKMISFIMERLHQSTDCHCIDTEHINYQNLWNMKIKTFTVRKFPKTFQLIWANILINHTINFQKIGSSTGLTGYRFFLLLCNFAPSRNKATATDWIDKKPT